jgi:Rps23 Pro-64 3,4-dihydroxylase Tpa1-like proline 4-hydroxylase
MPSFNTKLVVTNPSGSIYPLHIVNPQGLTVGHKRKFTCILYLNPEYKDGDGGELRICQNRDTYEDVTPDGGRMVLFWRDEIPHEFLPTAPNSKENEEKDRCALTLWIPIDNYQAVHNPKSKFSALGDEVFPSKRRI